MFCVHIKLCTHVTVLYLYIYKVLCTYKIMYTPYSFLCIYNVLYTYKIMCILHSFICIYICKVLGILRCNWDEVTNMTGVSVTPVGE